MAMGSHRGDEAVGVEHERGKDRVRVRAQRQVVVPE